MSIYKTFEKTSLKANMFLLNVVLKISSSQVKETLIGPKIDKSFFFKGHGYFVYTLNGMKLLIT